jgi:hypothetical protein
MTPINATPPTISLPALGAETAGIIHDNLGIVLTYAFSKPALEEYRGWLMGQRWDHSGRILRELPEQRATRAIIELAVMFRALDDAREITKADFVVTHPYAVYHPTGYVYGKLYRHDGEPEPLPLREVPNKIIHANSIEWSFSGPKERRSFSTIGEPLIVCHAAEADYPRFKWTRAEVFVKAFAAVCAALSSPRQ